MQIEREIHKYLESDKFARTLADKIAGAMVKNEQFVELIRGTVDSMLPPVVKDLDQDHFAKSVRDAVGPLFEELQRDLYSFKIGTVPTERYPSAPYWGDRHTTTDEAVSFSRTSWRLFGPSDQE